MAHQGYANQRELKGHEFTETIDLYRLTDDDIESILVLLMRPQELSQLVRLMMNLKVYVCR